MKWVTRERARVDRIACPWLISRFIDKEPTFLFVPANQVREVAAQEGAIPYDIPGVELGHHGERCSFDAFLEEFKLEDRALQALALIVRGADTEARQLTPESPGLYALATGFQAMAKTTTTTWQSSFRPTTRSTRSARRPSPGAPRRRPIMTLVYVATIGLPPHVKDGGFDHAAVDSSRGRLYVAHT